MRGKWESFASRNPIPAVISYHAEESVILRHTRSVSVQAPQVKLSQLGRLDERRAAHLDGMAVAGDVGDKLADATLKSTNVGAVFVSAIGGFENNDLNRLDKLFALTESLPEAQTGLTSALGWVSPKGLQGAISALLGHNELFRKRLGIAACGMHMVDPGASRAAAIASPDSLLRVQGLRFAGELGRRDMLLKCIEQIKGARIDLGQRSGSQWRVARATATAGHIGLASFGLVMYIDHVYINNQVRQWLCK